MKCTRKISKDKNLSVNDKMKKKIYFDFVKYPNELAKCIKKYDLFFHRLVYYIYYKEYIFILKKIGLVLSMQKNEIIVNLLTLFHILEIEMLDDISNL